MRGLALSAVLVASGLTVVAAGPAATAAGYARWPNGPAADPGFFPMAVWLQPPGKAKQYQQAGVNLYVGLWNGPTEAQLATLKQAGMRVICELNEVARRHLDDPTIAGWMHGDEPDNAQSLGPGQGYGPPVPPADIVRDYAKLRAADASRPVVLNLGQGVAWDHWHGRGVRTNHPEDYPDYVQGGDIVSFDIYPVVHPSPEVRGQLSLVARGVERLVKWSGAQRRVWNCLECTRISSRTAKPTPQQVRSEAWMSLIHGSQGLIYFVDEWEPRFNESALLSDPEMLAAVGAINHQIRELAPVLNSPSVAGALKVTSTNAAVPVAVMVKRAPDATYVFAVSMNEQPTTATFTLTGGPLTAQAAVLGENRTVPVSQRIFEDRFAGWEPHIYRLAEAKPDGR